MSEQVGYPGEHDDESRRGAPHETTGNEAVDAVLRSLDDVEGRPVGEQVAAFERAHERLRAALTGAGDPGGAPRPGPH
ncbi:MAG TPA: hypothetical protein VF165_12625 [Nocardioidaceae bacterium]